VDSRQAKRVLADVLRIDSERIDEATSRDNTPEWDSLKHITLVMALEEEFGVTFDVDEIESMLTFGDVLKALGRKA